MQTQAGQACKKTPPDQSFATFETREKAERSTRLVMWITLVTMALEIAGGLWTGSMALLADGWHMSSHALAIGLAAFAYAAARRLASDPSFSFGPHKIEVLAAFASAVFLLGIAILMATESASRWLAPSEILYGEALAVGVLGLVVNLVCAVVLHGGHDHQGHDHHGHAHQGHAHHGHEHHQDLNLKAAYIHVLTDALTSLLALAALAGGLWLGWWWLDPAMGIVGAILVAWWAKGLLIQSARVLLDREALMGPSQQIRQTLTLLLDVSKSGNVISDIRIWRVGQVSYAAAVKCKAGSTRLQTPISDSLRHQVNNRLHGVGFKLVYLIVQIENSPGQVLADASLVSPNTNSQNKSLQLRQQAPRLRSRFNS